MTTMHNNRVNIIPTKKFGVLSLNEDGNSTSIDANHGQRVDIYTNVNCDYTRHIVLNHLQKQPYKYRLISEFEKMKGSSHIIQICDFENIHWEPILEGKGIASSYITRKGLSRKAQLSIQLRRYVCKQPHSILKTAIPYTMIIDTWNAFDDMKVDFGLGTFASFDASCLVQMPLRQRLEWCLDDAKADMLSSNRCDWEWILKPSVTNKGTDITILDHMYMDGSEDNACHNAWDHLLDTLESLPDIREWVLQRYIAQPLLVDGYKFHLRVYVLCVGALQVYVYDNVLMLLAGKPYDYTSSSTDRLDIYRHLTNTARAAEIEDFQEERFVKLLDDLPALLVSSYPERLLDADKARVICDNILSNIHTITSELFAAFENEYTVFNPMSNCFEIYGLDYLVDDQYNVSLLEVNPGPDFKQTGGRLKRVINSLWEQTLDYIASPRSFAFHEADSCTNEALLLPDFTRVYSKRWSADQLQGMKLN